MITDDSIKIQPGMLFHWTDGPKWVLDTMGFGFDSKVHGAANCLQLSTIEEVVSCLQGDTISAVSTCYVYCSAPMFDSIREACPKRILKLLRS